MKGLLEMMGVLSTDSKILLILLMTVTGYTQVYADAIGFIADEHQLSTKEKRVGEAYYRDDMKWMIYQAEVSDDNPFYQIFLKNIASGDVKQVSPGTGKTTCAWIHPEQDKVLFSSTHEDSETGMM